MKQARPSPAVRNALLALADPTRLQLLSVLTEQCRACQCEPTSKAGPTMSDVCRCVDSSAIITPNMSRHMKKLRDVGLVHTYKQGRSHYCQPNTTLLNECAAYFTSLAREI